MSGAGYVGEPIVRSYQHNAANFMLYYLLNSPISQDFFPCPASSIDPKNVPMQRPARTCSIPAFSSGIAYKDLSGLSSRFHKAEADVLTGKIFVLLLISTLLTLKKT